MKLLDVFRTFEKDNTIQVLNKLYTDLHISVDENFAQLDSQKLLLYRDKVNETLSKMRQQRQPKHMTLDDMKRLATQYKKDKMAEELATLEGLNTSKDAALQQAALDYDNGLQELQNIYNQILVGLKAQLRTVYEPIYLLQRHEETIKEFSKANLITLSNYNIDYKAMSLDQIKRICNLCTVSIDEVLQGTKGKTAILKWLYYPLWQRLFTGYAAVGLNISYIIILLVAVLLVRPYVMAVVSLLFIIQIFLNVSVAQRNYKLLSVAYSISADFDNFDDYISELLADNMELVTAQQEIDEYLTLSKEDYLAQVAEEYDNKITDLKNGTIETSIDEEINKFVNNRTLESIIRSFKAEYDSLKAAKDKVLHDYNTHAQKVSEEIARRKRECAEANDLSRSSVFFDGNVDQHLNVPSEESMPYKERQKLLAEQKAVFFSYCDTIGGPGVPVTLNYYMATKLKTCAIVDNDGAYMGYKGIEIPFENLMIPYTSLQDRIEKVNLLRFMLSNVLGGVRENFLDIFIIDPEGLGKDFPEFNTKDLLDRVKIVTEKWDEFMFTMYNAAKDNLMSVGSKTFNQYNKDQSAENKTTLSYKLIIFLSTGGQEIIGNTRFLEFKNYSTDAGIWIWTLYKDKEQFKRVDDSGKVTYPEGIDEIYNWPLLFWNTREYEYKGQKVQLFPQEKYLKPVGFSPEICNNSVRELCKTITQRAADIIWYEQEYRTVFIPDEKIWTTSSAKGIELHFGFYEGDRSDNNPEWFGSDGKKPVHCLMCGATGAGKSATINQVLANMLHQYSPEELIMIMIDFKNVEFGMYTDKSVPGKVPPSIIPHARIIAGTTDGEYALSVFDYALKEMRVRQGALGVYQFQSIEDWNSTITFKYAPNEGESEKELLKRVGQKLNVTTTDYHDLVYGIIDAMRNEESDNVIKGMGLNTKSLRRLSLKHRMIVDGREVMPRMVILCDEFQVMFTEVEEKIVEEIKIRITAISKLARFAGCHLWFTSQSMKGTMSADILDQFALRCCLRCSEDTSKDVLGNDAAYKYLRGRGAIYTNADKGLVTSNHRYVIPFAPNEYIKEYLAMLAKKTRDDEWIDFKGDRRKGHIQYGALFYDEKFKHNLEEVDKWYDRDEVRNAGSLVILGERTYFVEEKIPFHCIVQKADGEHFIIAGNSANDRFYLANTILHACEKLRSPFIINCPDPELASLLNLDSRVSDKLKPFVKTNEPGMLFDFLDMIIERRTSNPQESDKPLFVFMLACDKLVGIGVGEDYKITDKFKLYLQKLGSLHVHIVITTRISKAFKSFIPYISHRVCAQSDEMTSFDLIDSRVGTTLSQDPDIARTAVYFKDNSTSKFKIYLSDIDESKLQVQSIKLS